LREQDYFKPGATHEEYKAFKDSIIWKDMQTFFEQKLFVFRTLLEDPKEEKLIQFIRGCCAEIRAILGFVDTMIGLTEEKQDETETTNQE